MTNSSHTFWDFSLRIYQAPEVAIACLSLQNDHRLDVNLVLFCLWYGTDYGRMPAPLLEQAYKHSARWRQNIVQPLRDTRSWMKSNGNGELATNTEFEALRQQIKTVELNAEKIQQHTLEYMVQEAPYIGTEQEKEQAATNNLMQLLVMHGARRSPELDDLLTSLIKKAVTTAES
jgi:uncharacterized protein (TIGR02444 family)